MKVFYILIIIIILSVVFIAFSCISTKSSDLGIKDGRFKKCPSSPNCISTQSPKDDKEHYMDPIKYTGTKKEVMEKIIRVVKSMARTTIIKEEDNYLHVEYRTEKMKFVDDVEFYIDEENKLIHFRSASRIGYSDLGLNRKRMTEFKERYYKD